MFRALVVRGDRRRLDGIVKAVVPMLPDGKVSLLDVGCGSGALAERLLRAKPDLHIAGIDIHRPPNCRIPASTYDGCIFPFPDNAFDLVLCADMLHHTESPQVTLREAARVARAWVIVKDHVVENWWERAIMTALDWIGNVGTGTPMPFNFLSSRQWQNVFSLARLSAEEQRNGLRYWFWPVSALIDRKMHFVVKLRPPQPQISPNQKA
ncbi:Demethylrebeccamycin-D-glucose O-methyltransferase [Thiorhodovibrio litoralis]|uniref:class I SAM-dependent methyltransferase n=1 Tax=Thiorhodovibrio winogradskyi TaxID=77007 RepID=UPI00237ADD90|nr:class I SAM-dependent methyltransferase [Thiorhodovibrio winogradskyi]MBK5970948.1 hypothetical protein [Thiorhodovibrio winogradskyi]WPL10686.1 Demethylrebeccamycin-D-glucose O-methyltransferase [Thiorhodovibrio litoralis]